MAKKMSKKEIDSFIKSTNITQNEYVAPTVRSNIDTRNVPAMSAVTQTTRQPQVQPVQQTVNTIKQPVENNLDLSPKSIGRAIGKAAKIAGKTIANVPTLMAEGALKTGESVIDTANDLSDAVTNAGTYLGNRVLFGKKVADKQLKKDQKAQEQFIKRNLVNDFENLTGWSKEKNKWEKDSLINSENLGGQVVQGIGGMVPALVAGQYAGITPNLTSLQGLSGANKARAIASNIGQTYLSQLPSNAILSASSYGGGLEEALNDGATRGQARLAGLANTAIEQGTEMLTGGVPGLEGRGGLDSLIEPLVDRNTNGYLNALIKAGYGAAGEGLEEYASTMLEPLARKIYSDEKINWDEVRNQARQAGLVGAATGAILNAPQNLQDLSNVRNENRVRRAIGDAEYAEGNNQYNPEYKGWEAQREENRQQEQLRKQEQEERNQKVAENNRLRQQEQQTQENNINTQETTNVAENALNDTIEANTPRTSNLENLDNNDRQNLENIYAKQRSGERLNKNELEQLQYLRRKSNNLKNPELKTNNTMQDLYDNKDYSNYYTKADLDNFDETILSKAKETIQANKQGKRTKQEWLDVAKNIGLQADNMNSEQLKQYAFASFKDARPNIKDNLNRQGQKYVGFKLNEWVNAVYEGAGVGRKLENTTQQTTQIETPQENIQNQQIEDLEQEIRQEERLVEQGKSDDGYHLAELQKELEDLRSEKPSTNATEKVEEPVIKVETPQQEKQHFVDNGVNEEVAKVLSEMPKVEKQPLREKIKEGKAKIGEEWSYLKRNLVDKGETIYTLGKKTKNPNLYAKYDKRGTTSGEANYDIGVAQTNLEGKRFNNFTDKNGKKKSMSLNEIWEGVDPEVANEYLAHYLNVDRYNQTNEDGTQKYVFGESVTDQDSLKRIAELEQEHPELKRFGENVWQYGKNQLQNRVDAGQISQAQADQFLKDTPHYVRLQRNVDTKTSPLIEFDKKGNVKVNKNLKEFKGSTLDILPFKESMAQYTLDVRNSIRDNLFAQELAKTLGIDGNGEVVNDLDDIMGTNPELLKDNGDGTYSLTFFNKGVATTIPINEGIYESLQPNKHYKFEDTLPFKGIRKFDNFRKALLTDKNPLFLATNMMKDAFDAPLNSKYPAQFIKNYPRAIKEIATNGKYYQQYQALGGLQNTYFDNKSFQKEGSKLNPMTWIEKGNNAVEQFPRLAEFISTMEKTGDIDQAMYNAAEITTNFKRGGDWTRAANRNGVTFLNASMQGFSKQIRNFTDIQEPRQAVQLLGKIVALGIAPGLINDAMWDDDDEYKELQDYQKDNYYLFKGKDGQWIRIPKGRAISVFQSAARRTKYALGGDEKAFNGFVDFAKNQVAPNSPFENNILSPITNVKENKSWSGNKIVNDSMAKRPEAEQFNEKTDEFSKWLGKKLNYSPMKINYLLDQYSGVVGDVTLPAITARSSSSTSNPIIASAKDKFTLDAVNSNKSVGTFYDVKDEIEKQKNSIKSTPIDAAKNSYMTSQSIALSDLYKKQKEIQNSDLSKKEKYKQAREVQKEINEFAKETVKNVQNIEEEKYYLKIGDSYYKRVIKDGEEKYVKDSSKKIPTEKYALYDYFKSKYEKSKESD